MVKLDTFGAKPAAENVPAPPAPSNGGLFGNATQVSSGSLFGAPK